jgi:hypothetical protein
MSENTPRPADTDNNLLRKICALLDAGGGGGGGGGGPTTIADGADVALGSTTDARVSISTGPASLIALAKGLILFQDTSAGLLDGISTYNLAISTVLGTTADAAVTNPVTAATIPSSLKGLLTLTTSTNSTLSTIASNTGNLSTIAARTPPLGQDLMTGSSPVVIASDQSAVPVRPGTGTVTDRSGTITSGGAAQTLAASNTARKYLIVVNVSQENLWINFTTTAVQNQPSIPILPNGSFVMESGYVSTELISIIGTTTGSAFTAKEG